MATEFSRLTGAIYYDSTHYGPNPATMAFDGDVGTAWLGSNGGVDWIQADVGRANSYVLTSYRVQVYSNAGEVSRAPKNWTLKGSLNNVDWVTLDTQTNQTDWTASEARDFNVTVAVAYRFIRLDITANNGDATYTQVGELYLYGNVATLAKVVFSPVNMTTDSAPSPNVVTYSSYYGGNEGFQAFDGNDATSGWMSNGATPWLKIDLGTAPRICSAYEIACQTTEATRAPKSWVLEGSANDSDWSTLDTVSGFTAWVVNWKVVFVCDAATTAYRYYRISVSENGEASNYTRIGGLYLYYSAATGGGGLVGGGALTGSGVLVGGSGLVG